MPVTIKSLIDSAARKIGILAGGGAQLAQDEYADALSTLRQMLDGWSLEDLMIPFHPTEVFPLYSDRNFYSMGAVGDWDTVRPEQVLAVRLVDVDGRKHALAVASIQVLQHQTTLTVRRPSCYAVNRDARFVYVEFDAYPEAGTSVLITTLKPFNATAIDNFDAPFDPDAAPAPVYASGFTLTGIQSAIDFPSGYEQCLIYNLAVHLAAEYGKPVLPEIVGMAGNSKRLVKRRNWRPIMARIDPAAGNWPRRGAYDVTSGPA